MKAYAGQSRPFQHPLEHMQHAIRGHGASGGRWEYPFAVSDLALLHFQYAYTYISRFTVNLHYQQREKSGETAAINFIPNRFSSQFSTSPTNGPRLPSLQKAGTHSALPTGSHTAAHRAKQGRFERGWYHYPRAVLRGSETLRGRVSERHTLPFCAREECVGKKQRAFWTSTHALCVDVQRRRGPVGTRSPAAGSCAVLVSFTVCHRCIQEQREKFAVGVAWFLLAA